MLTATVGSVIQTQFNMNAVAALDAPVNTFTLIKASLHDLVYFGPVWALMVAVTLAIAFTVTGLITRHHPALRRWLYPSAGGIGILALLVAMNTLVGFTPIAATRSTSGILLMAAPGLLGGWLFARLQNDKA